MNCRRCDRPMRRPGPRGLCSRCRPRRCQACDRAYPEPGERWCPACSHALRGLGHSHAGPRDRPDPGTLADRVALYAARAATGSPLFWPPAWTGEGVPRE